MELLVTAIILVIVVGLALLLIAEAPGTMQKPLKLIVIGAALVFIIRYAFTHGVFR